MAKPVVAIVGRPNVGKSMLFNKLTGRRTAIVEDTPGVTRDRIYGLCDWNGRTFDLIDTGGIEPSTDSQMLLFMRRQAEIAIEVADVIIMVTDVRGGMTAADQEVATMLKRSKKPGASSHPQRGEPGSARTALRQRYRLFHRDALGQVARLIHVASTRHRHAVSEELQRNHRQQRRK